jgi:hypothetical protein
LLLSAALAAVCVGAGTLGMLFATAPEMVSRTCEPLILLLLPGLMGTVFYAGPHDFTTRAVLTISFASYCVLFFLWLTSRAYLEARRWRRAHRAQDAAAVSRPLSRSGKQR